MSAFSMAFAHMAQVMPLTLISVIVIDSFIVGDLVSVSIGLRKSFVQRDSRPLLVRGSRTVSHGGLQVVASRPTAGPQAKHSSNQAAGLMVLKSATAYACTHCVLILTMGGDNI